MIRLKNNNYRIEGIDKSFKANGNAYSPLMNYYGQPVKLNQIRKTLLRTNRATFCVRGGALVRGYSSVKEEIYSKEYIENAGVIASAKT